MRDSCRTPHSLARKLLALVLLASLFPTMSFAAPHKSAEPPYVSLPFTLPEVFSGGASLGVGGNLLVYSDCNEDDCYIRSFDLSSGLGYTLIENGPGAFRPRTDGVKMVWEDYRNHADKNATGIISNSDIYGMDLSTRQQFTVTNAPQAQTDLFISGNIVVWTDYRNARNADDHEAGDIYMYDLATRQETLISDAVGSQQYPVTNGKVIVWTDWRNEPDQTAGFNSDIYGYDIATREGFVIANGPGQQYGASLAGDIVFWHDFRKGDESYDADIYAFDLTTRQEFPISTAPNSQVVPIAGGTLALWTDYRNDPERGNAGNTDIYAFDLATRREFKVFEGPGAQSAVGAAGNTLVWFDNPTEDPDSDLWYVRAARVGGEPKPALTPLQPPVALPGVGSAPFPETGKVVTGLFLDYWRKNGGLRQQGYPISDVMGEVSDLNGKPYTVQYFERSVFEYHPEEKPPHNVLLSQLGTFQYKQRYPYGAPGENPNRSRGAMRFKETGKWLGGIFLNYWKRNGGLAQLGYPISDEIIERSDLDGNTYLMQYFERAVMEYHPENRPPHDVLLSQLGTFQYRQKYGGK